jgi:hypothetical protein
MAGEEHKEEARVEQKRSRQERNEKKKECKWP